MQVLVIGGSGIVGSLVLPFLAEQHDITVFDRRPPVDGPYTYIAGDLTRYDDLVSAMVGKDAVLYMAMGSLNWDDIDGVITAYDVNIKGVHLALRAANAAGIKLAVYTSSMSIYEGDLLQRTFFDEDLTPDAVGLYGFTKWLGEEVCQNATRLWGMNVNALRLCHPTAEDQWLNQTVAGTPTIATVDADVARAILAALDYRCGFQAFTISGDYENKIMNMSKAKRLLGWEPLARPVGAQSEDA